ncbi:MAG: adenosylcobinamide-phosphate synthase CbiB [Actinomycetota bacterium]|nr:adenosylcobinamide-phosphate synthase CbiB [Actinomycetota bacterium]
MLWVQVAIAYVLDLAIGDPRMIPHPVVLIGRFIAYLEGQVLARELSATMKRAAGAMVVAVVVALSAGITWAIVYFAYVAHFTLGFIVSIWLISTTIATRGLLDSAKDVVRALDGSDLSEAKLKVSKIVGRDTKTMKRKDVVRATIESVSENAVDGVIAPLIFAMIGGAPLAMAYKAVNTLDSMLGYKNERYEDFGWAAARLDDVVNYIPARISVLILSISALLIRRDGIKALTVAVRDGGKHASVNSGYPEAAVAGAMGVRLGGTNRYDGVARKSGYLGDAKGALTQKNINEVAWLVFVASAITVLIVRAVYFFIGADFSQLVKLFSG